VKWVVTKSSNHFYFQLTGASGEILLNGELYTRQALAEEAVAVGKANANFDERYDRRGAPDGRSYFVLTAASGEVIGTSEMYASAGAMENGIATMKRNAPGAEVEEDPQLIRWPRPSRPR